MRTALDSSVVILLQRRPPGWEGWRNALTRAATEGPRLISPVAFAECSGGFPSAEVALREVESQLNFFILCGFAPTKPPGRPTR